MSRTNVALQLHTVREELATNPEATINAVADMGYKGVEGNAPQGVSDRDFRRMLDAAGLTLIGGGVRLVELQNDLSGVLSRCRELGITHLMTGIGGDLKNAGGDWKAVVAQLREACAQAAESGITICYHNHAFEFESRVDGLYGFDYIFSAIPQAHVSAEIDVYWVHVGGEDPVRYIRKYAGRLPYLHIKDHAPVPDQECPFAEVGHGILDWDAIFREAGEAGVEWYVVEQDRCTRPPLESAQMSLQYLKSRGMLD